MYSTTRSPAAQPQPEFYTADEVALKLRVKPDYVRRQCQLGALKATKLGNSWRIRPAAVEAFMADGNSAPATRPYRRRAS